MTTQKYKSRNKQPEYELQKSVILYLDLQHKGVLYCASAGGMRTTMVQAVKMKRTGYKKGFPDLFIYEPRGEYHGLALELKVKGNYASQSQKDWQKNLLDRGYHAVICTGLEQTLNEIDNYLSLDSEKK
jgi:hypothetical protein